MSDNDKQQLLLIAIEHLKFQYKSLHSPFVALLISKYYCLLSNSSSTKDQQEKYAISSRLWLARYIKNHRHSQKMQTHLHDFIQFHEATINAI